MESHILGASASPIYLQLYKFDECLYMWINKSDTLEELAVSFPPNPIDYMCSTTTFMNTLHGHSALLASKIARRMKIPVFASCNLEDLADIREAETAIIKLLSV